MLGKSYAVHERGTDKSHGFYQGHDQGGQEGSGWPGLFGTCCQRGIHKCCDNTGKVVWSSHRVGERHHLGKVLVALCVLSMTAHSNKQGEDRFAGWDSLLKRGYYMEMCRGSLKNCNRMRWHIRGWEDEKKKKKNLERFAGARAWINLWITLIRLDIFFFSFLRAVGNHGKFLIKESWSDSTFRKIGLTPARRMDCGTESLDTA